jgi:hypothetical protein
MIRIAILVDGAFYLRRANYLWGDKNPKDRARELVQYCSRHYMNKKNSQQLFRRKIPLSHFLL